MFLNNLYPQESFLAFTESSNAPRNSNNAWEKNIHVWENANNAS